MIRLYGERKDQLATECTNDSKMVRGEVLLRNPHPASPRRRGFHSLGWGAWI